MSNIISDLADGMKRLQALKKDLSELDLREEIIETRELLMNARSELLERDETIAELRRTIEAMKSGESCVICREGQMKVVDSRPHPTLGEVGLLEHTLKCSSCNHREDLVYDPAKKTYKTFG